MGAGGVIGKAVAAELSQRLTGIFLRDEQGHRAVHGGAPKFDTDPSWSDLILFYEYFHGDTGQGLGASHQTGWTALVTKLLQQSGDSRKSEGRRSNASRPSRAS